MERGSTLAERQGRRGRKHVPHREFRAQADATRLELDGFKAVNTEELDKVKASRDKYKKLFVADTPLINELKRHTDR
jgi:protein required for attachment to host cells